jgi:hypothetical protein
MIDQEFIGRIELLQLGSSRLDQLTQPQSLSLYFLGTSYTEPKT